MMFITIYFLVALFIGLLGRKEPFGFVGFTLISLFLTPFLGLIILLFLMLYARTAVSNAERAEREKAEKERLISGKSKDPQVGVK